MVIHAASSFLFSLALKTEAWICVSIEREHSVFATANALAPFSETTVRHRSAVQVGKFVSHRQCLHQIAPT